LSEPPRRRRSCVVIAETRLECRTSLFSRRAAFAASTLKPILRATFPRKFRAMLRLTSPSH
jgi:hypothetical protein